jgi:fermentation-respiration switch protein FrsA (DUF1100 family)
MPTPKTAHQERIPKLRIVLNYLVLPVLLVSTLALGWLRWESGLPRDEWFDERHGHLENAVAEGAVVENGQLSQAVRLISDTGLEVSFRVIRKEKMDARLPLLLIVGGHRTGSDAVDLFGDVSGRVIVGVDYPYDGPDKARGIVPIAKTIPLARQAILDTVPAVSLILDWLVEQTWIDTQRIIIVGASLGVPFAAAAAARDKRISGLMLIHGAADTRLWLQRQVERRIDTEVLHYPLATILYWLAYGPIFDTGKYIATISPRPVVIVGAREDERTPAGQAELLFNAAREPKRLRFTEGRHIQPNRADIVSDLLRIADEELAFLTQ